MHCSIIFSFGRDCRTFEAVAANWTKQRFIPSVSDSRCRVEEIVVPCQELFAERELGLWSILSTANVVKIFEQSFVGQTTPSDSNCRHTLFSSCVDKTNIRSWDIRKPKSCNFSTTKRLRVWVCNKKAT